MICYCSLYLLLYWFICVFVLFLPSPIRLEVPYSRWSCLAQCYISLPFLEPGMSWTHCKHLWGNEQADKHHESCTCPISLHRNRIQKAWAQVLRKRKKIQFKSANGRDDMPRGYLLHVYINVWCAWVYMCLNVHMDKCTCMCTGIYAHVCGALLMFDVFLNHFPPYMRQSLSSKPEYPFS